MLPPPTTVAPRPGVVPGSTSATDAPARSAAAGTLVPVPVCAFSVSVGLVTLPISCGASLRASTVVPSVRDNDHTLVVSASSVAVLPRLAPVALATGWSDTRTTSEPGVPLKSAAGTNRSCAVGDSSSALPSLNPAGTAIQPAPLLYSQRP